MERAGSTLTTLLNSHPEIRCITEKLDALKNEGKGGKEQIVWTNKSLKPPIIGQNRAIGFKTKEVDILDPIGFRQLLTHKNLQKSNCSGNSVKGVVSYVECTSIMGSFSKMEPYQREKPPVTFCNQPKRIQ